MRKRSGFTLVELMVAMALTIFVMLILSEAFILSIDTFVGLKAIGDMQENLRAASNGLRFDLGQDHLEGKRRFSDPTLQTQLPTSGFLAIYQGIPPGPPLTLPSLFEGLDGDNMSSARSANNILHFSSRLRGNQQQSFYTANIVNPINLANPNIQFFNLRTLYGMDPAVTPLLDADATLRPSYTNIPINPAPTPNIPPNGPPFFYRGQWAEIVYLPGSVNPATGVFQPLQPTGTTEEPLNPSSTSGMPLYGLYRAQYVAVPDNTLVNAAAFPAASLANFPGMACVPNGNALSFLTADDMATGTAWTLSPVGAPSGGAFTISCGGQPASGVNAAAVTTAPLPFNATAAAIQTSLAAGGIAATVSGGPINTSTVTIVFQSASATPIMVNSSALTGPFGQAFVNPALARTFNLVSPNLLSASLLVPNVLSFQVQTVRSGSPAPQDGWYDSAVPVINNGIFNPTPTGGPILGIAITLRVWDNKTRQTRQLTIMQYL
jgi:prepilin-type N-terminal cleavage/methylation domain-containing protein